MNGDLGDLKLTSTGKNKLLEILYNDIKFLESVKSYDYRLCMVFFKFANKQNESNIFIGKTDSEKKRGSRLKRNQFQLEKDIGYSSLVIKDIFNFVDKKPKKLKKFVNPSLSIENPTNYGKFLYDKMQFI